MRFSVGSRAFTGPLSRVIKKKKIEGVETHCRTSSGAAEASY